MLLVWAGFSLFVFLVTAGVAQWREIAVSGWEQAVQATQWYSLIIGVCLGWTYLPLHLAHGQTRRDFMAQAAVFVGAFAAVAAALVTATFLIESVIYSLVGWSQSVDTGHLYSSATDVPAVFTEWLLRSALWTAGGLFIASAWYRADSLGGLAIFVAILCAGLSGIAYGPEWGPSVRIFEYVTGGASLGATGGILLHVTLVTTLLALTWAVVRDIPLRSRKA